MIPPKTYFDCGVLAACNSMPALRDSDNTVELSLMQVLFANCGRCQEFGIWVYPDTNYPDCC